MIKNLILPAFSAISAVPSLFAAPTSPAEKHDLNSLSYNYFFLFTGALAFLFTVGGLVIGLKLSRKCLKRITNLIENTNSVLELNDDRLINYHMDNNILLRKVDNLIKNTDYILYYFGHKLKATLVSDSYSEQLCCCSSEESSEVTDEESKCSTTNSVVDIIEADVLVHRAASPSTEVFETSVNEESSNNNISYVTSM